MIVVLAILAGIAISVWWLVAVFWVHSREKEKELDHIELPDEITEVLTGIPPALWIFYVFIAITMLGYVLGIWLSGATY